MFFIHKPIDSNRALHFASKDVLRLKKDLNSDHIILLVYLCDLMDDIVIYSSD